MRINVSLMGAARAAVVVRVNDHFNVLASREVHRDQAHAAKRIVATAILAGGDAPAEFAAEAEMRGITSKSLAEDIVSKPNEAALRELARQRLLLAIVAATTAEELKVVLDDL